MNESKYSRPVNGFMVSGPMIQARQARASALNDLLNETTVSLHKAAFVLELLGSDMAEPVRTLKDALIQEHIRLINKIQAGDLLPEKNDD